MRFVARPVVCADDHQPRELPLGAGVGLQRHRGEAGNLAQCIFEVAEDLCVPLRLIDRGKGMHTAEVLPCHREHLGGRVQLHRARAERNHRGVEADILPLEAADVPHHRGLGSMRVEHRMRHERRRPLQSRRNAVISGGLKASGYRVVEASGYQFG